jgi:hypothetical protein
LVTGKERNGTIRHMNHPLQQQIRARLGAFPDHKGQYQSPDGRERQPHPGITIRVTPQLGGEEILLFGMHKAPQFIQLAFGDRQILPQIEHEQSAVVGGPLQPRTRRILIDLDNPSGAAQGISFGQCPHGRLENRRFGIQFEIGGSIIQRHTPPAGPTQCLFLAARGAIFDQQPSAKGLPVIATVAIGTVERFPVHGILPY